MKEDILEEESKQIEYDNDDQKLFSDFVERKVVKNRKNFMNVADKLYYLTKQLTYEHRGVET